MELNTMGRHKNHGHKMSPLRKYAKMAVKGLGIAAGVTVAASPVIDAAQRNIGKGGGGFKGFSEQLQRNYGRDPATGAIDAGKMVSNGVILPLIGVGIMWGFNQLAKKI